MESSVEGKKTPYLLAATYHYYTVLLQPTRLLEMSRGANALTSKH